jgi:8-oxo-dGTP pyrophosphatase MutT (NUDIX family)
MLFNGMTVQEKIEILSMRFDILWYKIWLEFPGIMTDMDTVDNYENTDAMVKKWKSTYKTKASSHNIPYNISNPNKMDFYIRKKNTFESAFMSDNGRRLRALIHGSTHGELFWEIPKGRKNKNEAPLDTAIRECKEETGVSMDDYSIMFDIPPIVESYVSMNTTYTNEYYTSYSTMKTSPNVSFVGYQASEVGCIKWVSIEEARYIDHSGRLYGLVKRVFNSFRSKYRRVAPPLRVKSSSKSTTKTCSRSGKATRNNI